MGALSAMVVTQTFVAPAMASTSSEIEATAKSYLGTPYVWAGTTPSGFDCSGYTQYVFKQHGINLPRTAAEQFNVGTSVSKGNLQKGDLVFFETYKKGPSHVGIYLGNGQFINSNNSGVSISSINSSYWSSRYLGAKRVLTGQQNVQANSVSSSGHSSNAKNQLTKQVKNVSNTVETSKVDKVNTVIEAELMTLNEDGKTYTVKNGDTLYDISVNFDVSVKKIQLLNEKTDTLIHQGDKLLVKGEPKLKVTLFEEVSEDKKEDTNSLTFLPEKDFERTEKQTLMFEQNSLTKAELATSLQFLVENNPSSIHLLKGYVEEVEIKDVPDEHWANSAIEWAVSNGFMKLDQNGEFHPDEKATLDDANYIFDFLYNHHELADSDKEYIQEQMDKNEEWSYKYMEQLTYDISLALASNEEKQAEESEAITDKQETSPSLSMAKERMKKVTGNMLEVAVNVPLINQNASVEK